MKHNKTNKLIVKCICLVALLFLVTSCAPRSSYLGDVKQFSEANKALGERIKQEELTLRTSLRLQILRWAQKQAVKKGSLSDDPDFKLFLCDPIRLNAAISRKQGHLDATASGLELVAAPPEKDFDKLLSSLGNDYEIIGKPAEEGLSKDKQCKGDIDQYLSTVLPEEALPENVEFLQFVAAAQAIYEVWQNVGKPIATEVLLQIDEGRRADALKEYLSNKKNIEALRNAVEGGKIMINYQETTRRHLKVKQVKDAFDDWKASLNKAIPENQCIGLKTNDELYPCVKTIWNNTESQSEKLVSAAAEYDIEIDQNIGDATERLLKAVKSLENTANGEFTIDIAKEIFSSLTKMVDSGKTISNTLSNDENKEKICLMVVQVNKAFGNKNDDESRCKKSAK
jgi:hypothetical protein